MEKYTYLLLEYGYKILDENDRELGAEEICDALEQLEAENAALKRTGRGLVNSLPDLELEIAEEGWGVTNANVVRHWRDKLAALLTAEEQEEI